MTALNVTLATFEAASQNEYILITWQTVSELSNLGFNFYRAEVTGTSEVPVTWTEGLEQLNTDFIPSQVPGSGQGAAYQFVLKPVEAGTTYVYWLEDVDTEGNTRLYGPISTTANIPTALSLQEFQLYAGSSTILWLIMTMVVLMGLTWRHISLRE